MKFVQVALAALIIGGLIGYFTTSTRPCAKHKIIWQTKYFELDKCTERE